MKRGIMLLPTLFSLVLPLILLFSVQSVQAAGKIEGGLVDGVVEDGLTVCKGIPFAEEI